ncbi:MAG TPA: sigma factor, partial [Ktedonobacterales bacterium]|nr:sigma factor [Ktedonobacterales bacterium]
MPTIPISETIEYVYRQEAGRILASLIALVGDFTLAEDALQDAVVIALQSWPQEGVPRNPAAWLATIARRKAIDRLRRDTTLARKQPLLEEAAVFEQTAQGDALDAALANEAEASD